MVKYEDRVFKISNKANKFIKSLPKAKRGKIKEAVGCLIENKTENLNIKRLLPYPKEFRLKVDDVRLLFRSDKEMLFIFNAGYRKDIYK
jgi:mRNA-degrading endonuclease RelE of RelBE toxin-antitoxin system